MNISFLKPWIAAIVALAGMTLLGPVVRAVLMSRIQHLIQRTETRLDDVHPAGRISGR